jgi:hypothetical protein
MKLSLLEGVYSIAPTPTPSQVVPFRLLDWKDVVSELPGKQF